MSASLFSSFIHFQLFFFFKFPLATFIVFCLPDFSFTRLQLFLFFIGFPLSLLSFFVFLSFFFAFSISTLCLLLNFPLAALCFSSSCFSSSLIQYQLFIYFLTFHVQQVIFLSPPAFYPYSLSVFNRVFIFHSFISFSDTAFYFHSYILFPVYFPLLYFTFHYCIEPFIYFFLSAYCI